MSGNGTAQVWGTVSCPAAWWDWSPEIASLQVNGVWKWRYSFKNSVIWLPHNHPEVQTTQQAWSQDTNWVMDNGVATHKDANWH